MEMDTAISSLLIHIGLPSKTVAEHLFIPVQPAASTPLLVGPRALLEIGIMVSAFWVGWILMGMDILM